MLRRFSFPLLTLLLLWPAAAPAQTAAKAPPRSVSVQVSFVTASMTDVENLGVNFDLLPLPVATPNNPAAPPPTSFLQFATGNIVSQLYQTLTRFHGKVVDLAPVTMQEDAPAPITVDAKVPAYTAPFVAAPSGLVSSFPRLSGFMQVQGKLTLTAHVYSDNMVTLFIASPLDDHQTIRLLKTIPSGQPIVIVASPALRSDIPILGALFRTRNKVVDSQELLIFITPTVVAVPDAPAQTAAPVPEKTCSIDVAGADLQQVVTMLERQTGIEAIVLNGSKSFQPINAHLQDATISKAVRMIALSAGASLSRTADGTYIFAGDGNPPIPAAVPPPPVNTPLNPADLQWHRLILYHTVPGDIIKLMHWEDTISITDGPVKSDLPSGVARVFALQSNNSLLIQATPEGFQRARDIVKILDIAPRSVEPDVTFSTITVPAKEVAGFQFDGNTKDVFASGVMIKMLFDQLMHTGHAAVQAQPVAVAGIFQPHQWVIPGYLLSYLDFQASLSLPLTFESLSIMGHTVHQVVNHGDVVALDWIDNSGKAQITFIKAEY